MRLKVVFSEEMAIELRSVGNGVNSKEENI